MQVTKRRTLSVPMCYAAHTPLGKNVYWLFPSISHTSEGIFSFALRYRPLSTFRDKLGWGYPQWILYHLSLIHLVTAAACDRQRDRDGISVANTLQHSKTSDVINTFTSKASSKEWTFVTMAKDFFKAKTFCSRANFLTTHPDINILFCCMYCIC